MSDGGTLGKEGGEETKRREALIVIKRRSNSVYILQRALVYSCRPGEAQVSTNEEERKEGFSLVFSPLFSFVYGDIGEKKQQLALRIAIFVFSCIGYLPDIVLHYTSMVPMDVHNVSRRNRKIPCLVILKRRYPIERVGSGRSLHGTHDARERPAREGERVMR